MKPTFFFVRGFHWTALQEIILLLRNMNSHHTVHQSYCDLGVMLFVFNANACALLRIKTEQTERTNQKANIRKLFSVMSHVLFLQF